MNIISVFWVVSVEDELLTLWKKTTYTYIIVFIYTSFGFIWDIEIQPEKRAGKSLTIAFHQFSKETDSMSYVLWIWSICPCGAHLVTESFVVKSTSQLDIDLLSGSHVVWIDWSKGFRGFNSIVHWRFQGKKRWEQMTEGFHPNYNRQEMGTPVPDLMGKFLWLQLLRLTISLHCLLHSRSRKTPPWMFWWWPVGMVWGAKGLLWSVSSLECLYISWAYWFTSHVFTCSFQLSNVLAKSYQITSVAIRPEGN